MSAGGARRELTAAALGAVLAGVLALSASGQRWADVTAERRSPLPPVSGTLSGGDVAPLVTAAGLVLLAAAVALFAVRGAGRRAVGLVTAAAGGALVWSGVRVLTGGVGDAAGGLPGLSGSSVVATSVDASPVWPVLVLLAGLLALVAGLLITVRGGIWPAMGRRYERTGTTTRPRTDEDRAQDAWKALDRGEDPTEPPPPARSGDPV